MKYTYYNFTTNRSIADAEKIYSQRIEDAKYIFDKYNQNFITRDCPVCGSCDNIYFDKFHDMYGIDKCKRCSSLFVNPVPNIDALSDYYENCICNRQLSKVIKDRYDNDDFINDERVQLIIQKVKGILSEHQEKKTIKILEVGCNNGAFLSKLRQALESYYKDNQFELCGVDIDSIAVENSVDKKLNLFQGLAEEITHEHNNTYDIILHFELVEHLINPRLFIASIHKMLVPEGIMIFTTPNILGLDNQALGYNNTRYLAHAIFPPMHVNAYSIENISHFLILQNFSVEEISTPGKFDIDMISQCKNYLNEEVFKDLSILDEDIKALLQTLIAKSKFSSHMQCIARKM